MPSHWAYKHPTLVDQLEQGDVLKLTDPLIALLRDYHPYYADHPANRFYQVLTQSCDLVQRTGGIKSRYIAVAPIRPLPKVIEYEFQDQVKTIGEVTYGSARAESEVVKFLERLFNNNEPSYFYLEPEPQVGLSEPMCAMLPLGIAFKSDHYQTFLDAKIIGLRDSFQAKLGWLLGQSYSRVGTQDFDREVIAERAKAEAKALGIWVDSAKYNAFEKQVKKLRDDSPENTVTLQMVEQIVEKLPTRKGQVVDAVLDIAAARGFIPAGRNKERFALRQTIEQDPAFAEQFRE